MSLYRVDPPDALEFRGTNKPPRKITTMAGPVQEMNGFLSDQGILNVPLIEDGNGWKAVRADHDRVALYPNIKPVTIAQLSAMLQATPAHDKTRAALARETETSDESAIDHSLRKQPKKSNASREEKEKAKEKRDKEERDKKEKDRKEKDRKERDKEKGEK